jgi:hypothetical protein
VATTEPEHTWTKSSFCGSGACVEVADTDGGVLMRDGKNPDQAPIAFSRDVWADFIAGIKADEFGQH